VTESDIFTTGEEGGPVRTVRCFVTSFLFSFSRGGAKAFSFFVLQLIQFILHSLGGVCVLLCFFHLLGPRGHKTLFPFLRCCLFSLYFIRLGAKAFFFSLLRLIQFISFTRWRFCSFPFFHSLGGTKPFSFLVLQLIQFIFSFARWRFFIYVILVCFKIVPTQNPYFSTRSRWTVVIVSSDLVLHFRLKISSFLPF